jgi:3-hydroxyacyl-[acyl-carrier-protein] dehydratase
MLRNSFYTIIATDNTDITSFKFSLRFQASHDIFKGHFPGLPVVPGVCMMQIVKELLEMELQRSLHLRGIGNVKFLSVINPIEHPQVDVIIRYKQAEEKDLEVDGSIVTGEKAFFKMAKALYS